MSQSNRLADIIGAAAGIGSVILIFLGVASVDPLRGASDQELLTWWADSGNRDGFIVSMYLLLAACPLLLLFFTRMRMRLRAADAGGWADVAFACGIVATGALSICAILRGIIPASVRFDDEPLPGVDTLRFATTLAYAAWDPVILFAGAYVAVVTTLALTTHAFPRWFGWLGVPVSLGCAVLLVLQSGPLALPLLNVWILAGSVHLLRSSSVMVVESVRQSELSNAQA
jgi:hypothetical protein